MPIRNATTFNVTSYFGKILYLNIYKAKQLIDTFCLMNGLHHSARWMILATLGYLFIHAIIENHHVTLLYERRWLIWLTMHPS